MPTRAKRPCRQQGCPELTNDGWCAAHRPPDVDDRPSAASRGYGRRWRRLRRMVLSRQPLCADPFGDHAAARRVVAATDVHHVIARRDGGRDVAENLQTLCHSCHSRITGSEGRGVEIPAIAAP